MRINDNRMSSADWINLSNCLELNDAQKFLFMVLPHIAETNGCFEHNPKMITSLTQCKLSDLEQLFRIMASMGLLIAYKAHGGDYWYLTKFLEMQRLRTKSKIPCPPWLYWEPEASSQDMSKGKYKVYHDKLQAYTGSLPLDKKPPLEVSRGEKSGEEIKITDSACAFNNDDKQRYSQALKDVLDGEQGIRSVLVVDKLAQKYQILAALKCKTKYKISDLSKRFDIEPVGDDWQVYERMKNDNQKTSAKSES
jgi:hypothetical protein